MASLDNLDTYEAPASLNQVKS